MTVDGKQVTQIGDRLLLLNGSRLCHHCSINRQPLATEWKDWTVFHLQKQRHRLRLAQPLAGNLEDIRKWTDAGWDSVIVVKVFPFFSVFQWTILERITSSLDSICPCTKYSTLLAFSSSWSNCWVVEDSLIFSSVYKGGEIKYIVHKIHSLLVYNICRIY